MKRIKRTDVALGQQVRIQLFDGSFRIGPVYGLEERKCRGVIIEDRQVVLRVWVL